MTSTVLDALDGPTDEGRAGELTDTALLEAGYASVTAVLPVVEDPSLDLAAALGPGVLGLGAVEPGIHGA